MLLIRQRERLAIFLPDLSSFSSKAVDRIGAGRPDSLDAEGDRRHERQI